MKLLRVALLALSALVVAGCAPSVVGGTYSTATVQTTGWIANSITLEFLDASTVRIGMVQGGEMRCREKHDASIVRQWRTTSDGKISISTVGTCLLEVPSCDASGATIPGPGGVNACEFFAQAFSLIEQCAPNLLVSDTGLLFNRR